MKFKFRRGTKSDWGNKISSYHDTIVTSDGQYVFALDSNRKPKLMRIASETIDFYHVTMLYYKHLYDFLGVLESIDWSNPNDELRPI